LPDFLALQELVVEAAEAKS